MLLEMTEMESVDEEHETPTATFDGNIGQAAITVLVP